MLSRWERGIKDGRLKLIDPKEGDIGFGVIYIPNRLLNDKNEQDTSIKPSPGEIEEGVITSFNEKNVFVRYKKQHPSQPGQATSRHNLFWSNSQFRKSTSL